MKHTEYKTFFSHAFIALTFMGAVSACVEEENIFDSIRPSTGEELIVLPSVAESQTQHAATRAAAVESLNEKVLNTLDIFVEPVTDGIGTGTFMKQYHLTATTSSPIVEKGLNWLADRWRQEGFVKGKYYNVYVATNNNKTSGTKDLATFDVAELKALVYNEVTENIAVVDEKTGNIANPASGELPSGNIYKTYAAANPNGWRAWTTDKQFMMDGVIKNWTPNPSTPDQVFDVTLNRAAAKVVMNVKFKADFLTSLTKNTDGTEKPDRDKAFITGSPAWKFYNFAFGAPVFDPGETFTPVEVHNSDFNIYHHDTFVGDDKHFTITTYSYPNIWAKADYSSKAPSLIVSVPFSTYKNFDSNGNAVFAQGHSPGDFHSDDYITTYNYYRIPIVPSTSTTLDRNHIYVINATLSTRGSTSQDDVVETENLTYEVLPWNDESNSQVKESDVTSVQNYYLNVSPKVYTLRGDGEQTLILNYSKAKGTKVDWKLFTYKTNGDQDAVVAKDTEGAVRAWFYNSSGAMTTTYSDGVNDWSTMGVTITNNNEGDTSNQDGTITITSTALTNKAIKYIRLRVYLDEPATFEGGKETLYEDIIIRHFPTDNIQNIEGHWASYTGSSTTHTFTTRDLAEAQAVADQYGVPYTSITSADGSATDYITYAEYQLHSTEAGYSVTGPTSIDRNTFLSAVTSENDRRSANGQANARLVDGIYYWGTDPQASIWYALDYDYHTGSGFGIQLYRYNNYFCIYYTHTYTYTTYSFTYTTAEASGWVDWGAADKNRHRDRRTESITYGNNAGTFNAKVFENGTMYDIDENSHGTGTNRYYSTDRGDDEELTNNHMYVIQISATSDTYVLGRPYIDQSTHQSQDNVVSPAFMIASQLGAVFPFTGNDGPANAATHCSRYMEVAQDGTRYTGWRLPTKAEISVITGYQYGTIGDVTVPAQYRVLVPVLTGQWYHSLSGQEVEANPNAGAGSTTKSYLRCVRDLSAEEIKELNGFEDIVEKYQK